MIKGLRLLPFLHTFLPGDPILLGLGLDDFSMSATTSFADYPLKLENGNLIFFIQLDRIIFRSIVI
ncbi:hypothetical protein [Halalkalibacter lacteus]|uniref:hypothetical protein n=1 Tax=Halalkalibacter lacteus TaxID=3090663 RepID=UPI002FC895C9